MSAQSAARLVTAHIAKIKANIKLQSALNERDAAFETAKQLYVDMRARGIAFPPEQAAELDALFGGAA